MKKILISAIEVSGDMHAANLVKAIKKETSTEFDFFGFGSDALKEQGVIRFDKAQLINAFAELTRNAQGNLKEENMKDFRKIFETIKS